MKNQNTDQIKSEYYLAGGLVLIGIATRLLFNVIHFYNFNAVVATAIFAGAYLTRSRYGILVPLITMLATDAILGFYDWQQMAVVYGAFIVAIIVGKFY